MSTLPAFDSPRRHVSVAGSVLVLCVTVVAACADRPTESELLAGPQYAPPAQPAAYSCDKLHTGGARRTADIAVTQSNGEPAENVIATLIDPDKGPACWGATDSDGLIRFTNISTGARFLVSLRHGVSIDAPLLEVSPAHPNMAAIKAFKHDPSTPLLAPLLLSGVACTSATLLTWDDYGHVYTAPCVMPNTGLTLAVEMDAAPDVATIKVVDPTNPTGLIGRDVLIAGISVPSSSGADFDVAVECAKMPWLKPECADPKEFSGPGLLQAMNVTTDASIVLGLARGEPLIIEAIAAHNGFTLFGTAPLAASGETTVYLQPGMCSITTIGDDKVPSGSSNLNIRESAYSIGLETDADGLKRMKLLPVPKTLVVRTVIEATKDGTGQFDLKYRGVGGGNLAVRVPFSIQNDVCEAGPVTGSGVAAVNAVGYCSASGGSAAVREFTLFVVMTNIHPGFEGEYTVKAHKDNHPDPWRSEPSIVRGAVRISPDALTVEECPVTENNDGRWLVV